MSPEEIKQAQAAARILWMVERNGQLTTWGLSTNKEDLVRWISEAEAHHGIDMSDHKPIAVACIRAKDWRKICRRKK